MKSLGVADIGKALRAKKFSSTELTQQLLTGVTANAQLGTFLATDAESALAQASAADARIARGEGGPLNGVPLAHVYFFIQTITDSHSHRHTKMVIVHGARIA